VAAGAWFVVDADPKDALSPRPQTLWRDVLRRQRGRLALFAHYPDDPSSN
jgi:putative transcriptional regulator